MDLIRKSITDLQAKNQKIQDLISEGLLDTKKLLEIGNKIDLMVCHHASILETYSRLEELHKELDIMIKDVEDE